MFFIRILSHLPLSVLYRVSDFLFLISYYVVRYRRKLVRKNLLNSFPHYAPADRNRIERLYYKNFCDYGVETLKLYSITKEELGKRMTFKNLHIIEEYRGRNQSVLILSAHQFNWEWLLTAGNFSLPVPVDFVYQPVNNITFDRFSLTCRTKFGAYPIRRDEVARETIKRKHILRGLAIIADQYPGYTKDKKYHTTFLHQDTVFFQGAQQLAVLTQYPVVFADVKKTHRGYYTATFIKISEPPYTRNDVTVMERYIRLIEKNIQEEPTGWLWSHNRWKKRHVEINS
jgi:Kdo2-lipid IVA lauroyltransferase/acyltransferase